MAHISQASIHNRLLRAMSADDFGLLQPHLNEVSQKKGAVISEPNEPIKHVHFPERGIASIVATTGEGHRLEVGIYGRDGMSGITLVLGSDRTPHKHFYQVEGSAIIVAADELTRAIQQSPLLNRLMLRYVQSFQVQITYTALSNGTYSIEERLARWLLMCHDRIDGDELPLTHEFLGIMLGVRRSSVSLALKPLEAAQVITARWGRLTILKRSKLEEIAGDSYGPPEAEYARLIGRAGNGRGQPAPGFVGSR